jgi:hypothetical protein
VVGIGRGSAIDQLPEVELVPEAEGGRAAGELAGQVVELGVVAAWGVAYRWGFLKRGLRGME